MDTIPMTRVLIAEDMEMNRQLVRILLNHCGCAVDEAENGQLALAAAQSCHYDLILMDCLMPVMDGYQACAGLREWERATAAVRTPVIALTGSAMPGDREYCLAAGMDDYLLKPFSPAALMAVVSRWIVLVPVEDF
jgi:hypothetical protein